MMAKRKLVLTLPRYEGFFNKFQDFFAFFLVDIRYTYEEHVLQNSTFHLDST